ncbi:hypothetical protein QKU48_gp0424 [Fadolivirus algeromassiliense]|jgi:hypothetical protein|uniref:Uncharacterized protein n=1 Tax=Fadolivirus FV1/VV64 TaxID=3070911 RepID=A0A7D3R0P2_9VIRU|nr:hypothetical protein QKU48_gp0424 [Fadolivirus algeromassiliense]QKF93882.1 hypothetical protein Fadolivirus_1_424 [Fadolivirus FV1/VV64]
MTLFADQLRENYAKHLQEDNMSEFNSIITAIQDKESIKLRKQLDPLVVSLLKSKDLHVETEHKNAYDCGCDYASSCHGCHGAYDETTIINLPYKYNKIKESLINISKTSRSYSINGKLNQTIVGWLSRDGISAQEKNHPSYDCGCDYMSSCHGCRSAYTETILSW